MVKWRVIACRQTEHVSPLVTVKKKDDTMRVCLDARYLNSRMVKDHVIPPNLTELCYDFSPNHFLSTIDFTAYWQIHIAKEHQKYTGFAYEGFSLLDYRRRLEVLYARCTKF